MSRITEYNKELNKETLIQSFDNIKLNQKSRDLIECITKEKEKIKSLVGELNKLSAKTKDYKGQNFEEITKNGAVEGKKTLKDLNEFKVLVEKEITEYEIVEKVYRIKNLCENNSELCKKYEHIFEDPSLTVTEKEIGENALERLKILKNIEQEIEDKIAKEERQAEIKQKNDDEEQKNDDEEKKEEERQDEIDQKNDDEEQKKDDEEQKNDDEEQKKDDGGFKGPGYTGGFINKKRRREDEDQKKKKKRKLIKQVNNSEIDENSKAIVIKTIDSNFINPNFNDKIMYIVQGLSNLAQIQRLTDNDNNLVLKNIEDINNRLSQGNQLLLNNSKNNSDFLKGAKKQFLLLLDKIEETAIVNYEKKVQDSELILTNVRDQLSKNDEIILKEIERLNINIKELDDNVKTELSETSKLLEDAVKDHKDHNLNTIREDIIELKNTVDKLVEEKQEILNIQKKLDLRDNELNKLNEVLVKERKKHEQLTNELKKKKLDTTGEEKEKFNKLTEELRQSNAKQEKLKQDYKEEKEKWEKEKEKWKKEKNENDTKSKEQMIRLNEKTKQYLKLKEEQELQEKEHKIKKMAEDCEKHRVEAEIIFDNLKMNLEEGLKSTQINDLQKKLIIVKAKEFELCHILHIYLKNLKIEKQKIRDMKDLMKEEDTLWNKIFPKKEKEEREIIGKIKEINLQDIKKNIRNFMKNNFCYLWDKDRIEEKFGIGNYLESIVEQ